MKTILRHTLPALALTCILAAPVVHAQEAGTGVNYETRLMGLEGEVRALNGRIEQIEFTLHRIDQSLQRLQGDYDARIMKLEAQATAAPPAPPVVVTAPPPPAPAAPVPVPAPQGDVAGTLGSLKTQEGRVTGGSVNPQQPALPDTPADYGLTPQEQYDRAFGLLRSASYDEAEKAFKQFIDKNPKDKLIDNAKYWFGETQYVRGRFNESAVAFADAFQQNPKGTKAPDSLLKLALSLANIDKIPDACTTLGELKVKYPNAPASIRTRASETMSKLKCPK